MDFFEAQQRARRITWKLVALYSLAVALIVVSVYLVLLVLLGAGDSSSALSETGLWNGALFVHVVLVLGIIILGGSLFRLAQLRRGGEAVAEMLGGRKVDPSTRNAKERQLLNVVEEMALASGMAVPSVYILDKEPAINAFAAGFGTADAAIGVTRGTLEQLTRDELQGVIAHEFSHIFNSDMRLNIRLIAVLNGILLLHLMGLVLMRSAMYARLGGSGRRGGGAQAALAMVVLGLALVVIGYTGMLFARMIQAAISRQREYLADAAAVQYTRNPAGLAGALRKIGGKQGSTLADAHAMELSHLFFASGFNTALDRLFATHPPIEERIRAIDPAFDGPYAQQRASIRKKLQRERIPPLDSGSATAGTTATSGTSAGTTAFPLPGFPGSTSSASGMLTPAMVLAAIGTLGSEPVLQARRLMAHIPARLVSAAHEPLGAQALAAALLLAARESDDKTLPDWFDEQAGPDLANETRTLHTLLREGRREWFLPLMEVSLPVLRSMSAEQYSDFKALLQRLIHEDHQVSLFEFAMEKTLIRQLDLAFSEKKLPHIRHDELGALHAQFEVLLSAMAHASEGDTQMAFESGLSPVSHLGELDETLLLPAQACTPASLEPALEEWAAASAPLKKTLLTALVHAMLSDRKISIAERELLRAVSESIDCPIPMAVL